VVIAVSTAVLWAHREALLTSGSLELAPLGRFLLTITFDTALWVAGALLALAFVDYGFQRWKLEQDLRMTPREARDEMKNMQGDPQIAAQRRKAQRGLARNSFGDVISRTEGIV
jgi:flagellar biosynthetic protein FlhB